MRIAIFGVGGAGGHFGAHLAKPESGADVVMIARGDHADAIRAEGLRLETPDETFVARPGLVTDRPEMVGPVDAIILGVKTWQLPEVVPDLQPLLGPETFVVPLQNGVEAAPQLAAGIGDQHVVGGLCATVSYIAAPGTVRNMGGVSWIRFGELDRASSARTLRLQEAFTSAGVQASIPDDIWAAIWKKFLFVVPWGAIGAVSDLPIGVIRRRRGTRAMLQACMEEILALARAKQINLDDEILARTMQAVDSVSAEATTSLQRDILAGRPSELEAWVGAVVRHGRELGVAVPLHEFLYDVLCPGQTSPA